MKTIRKGQNRGWLKGIEQNENVVTEKSIQSLVLSSDEQEVELGVGMLCNVSGVEGMLNEEMLRRLVELIDNEQPHPNILAANALINLLQIHSTPYLLFHTLLSYNLFTHLLNRLHHTPLSTGALLTLATNIVEQYYSL